MNTNMKPEITGAQSSTQPEMEPEIVARRTEMEPEVRDADATNNGKQSGNKLNS